MNLNSTLLQLKTVTGLDVEQDVYTGKADKWIVFTYEDERSALNADDAEDIEQTTVMVNLYVPMSFNYFLIKNKIKKHLADSGFAGITSNTVATREMQGTEYMRRISFSATYA